MSSHPTLYLAAEIAALLGVTVATLPRKWRRLNERHGFPRPIPGRADAWSRIQVDDWIATPEGERGQARAPRREARITRERELLEARYAGGAHV